jgi:hypothetical protein
VGGSELRDQTLRRQRELAARHEVLARVGADPQRHEDQLARVFDATNDLIAVLDRVDARIARRRTALAFALLGLVVVIAVLVATRLLPGYGLLVALVLLPGAVAVRMSARRADGGTRKDSNP